MSKTKHTPVNELSCEEFDEIHHPRPMETDFGRLVEREISRRGFLGAGIAFGASAFVVGAGGLRPSTARAAGHGFGFEAIPANTLDTVTVPSGYNWHVVAKWGEPMWSNGAEFDHMTRGTGESQELSFGDNNDGMSLYNDGEGRSVLAVNNEYTNLKIMYGGSGSGAPQNADDVRKGKAAHGVSVVEIAENDGKWSIVVDSPYNRKFTADAPMEITGPARGHDLLKTAADPEGVHCLGTWNNCGNGRTPWGTYLACEENFHSYYSSSDPDIEIGPEFKRYGVGPKDRGYAWAMADERFDIAKHPNEPNRNGYIVEIDPLAPDSTPKKRTAMGRFKHENAEIVIAGNGQVVGYMGDDERGEFLYRFVSDGTYAEGGDNADLLESGRLFVAKFADGGRGEWVELTPESSGMASQAEVCIHARIAASAVGATTMDRPEWVAANPIKAEVYCCLTNNKNRGKKPNAGGDPTPAGGPNPRVGNLYGQILRWRPDGGDHLAAGFDWDLYVVAGNPTVHSDANAGSANVTADNMFNSPDGLGFDSMGRIWIQTDGNYSNKDGFAGQGNNQMLVGDPETGEIQRFMVGPNECEVTGFAWSADRKTLFVGIQHPGERGNSHFPDGGDTTPRSSIVAISRDDGGIVG
ncbi:MAG: PhoX family phosphatase [Immundisolibacterales bacterium]|nr:PhoX family phosphatase [Immundisolibacterales bacterium]